MGVPHNIALSFWRQALAAWSVLVWRQIKEERKQYIKPMRLQACVAVRSGLTQE
ncbi:hypothetical Protein YC6258_04307 [Gynuella sunshinyii YC6258]|uniref:Uncharacterized protein n=1 Tax=Gynuella sunshinyii YC6258 TaxID=1445510 RepID=A0A0C5VQ22_9GAMM|nr:hypothetical Protein YC6258_04307 [Gynuella sunshinyii YC6258]